MHTHVADADPPAYYDRILVMDQGEVAEFDAVLNLYDREDSIFQSLCNEANLHRADILQIRAENAVEYLESKSTSTLLGFRTYLD